MVAITVRNVPDAVHDALAARAAESGRSLQEYLLLEFERLAARPTLEALINRARKRARRSGIEVDIDEMLSVLDAGRD